MSTSVKFKLKAGYTRAIVAVQELADQVVVEADKPFVTSHPGVIAALDHQPALERVPATKKGGD